MVLGIPKLEHSSRMCEECVMGKQHRKSFPKKSSRAPQPLDPSSDVYSDVCGPSSPTLIRRSRIFSLLLMISMERYWYMC